MSGTWLTPEEVGELTGLKPNSYKAQCRRLERMGVSFLPNGIGRPLVERVTVLQKERVPAQRKRTEPNWAALEEQRAKYEQRLARKKNSR